MILLDTHAWIWWVISSPRLSKKAAKAIRSADAIGVSVMECWEVAMLVTKGRLVFDRDVEVWISLALKLPRTQLVPLSPSIAVRSTRLQKKLLQDPVDCMLVATALEYGCPIVSKDVRIRKFPNVQAIW